MYIKVKLYAVKKKAYKIMGILRIENFANIFSFLKYIILFNFLRKSIDLLIFTAELAIL